MEFVNLVEYVALRQYHCRPAATVAIDQLPLPAPERFAQDRSARDVGAGSRGVEQAGEVVDGIVIDVAIAAAEHRSV